MQAAKAILCIPSIKPSATEKGKTYTIKPTMVYNKGGKLHKAVITIKMKY